MENRSIEDLLRDFQIAVTNNVTGKRNQQAEGYLSRVRKVNMLKQAIIMKVGKEK